MKSYNHLWELFISEENITLAIEQASKGKYDRNEIIQAHQNLNATIKYIKEYAENFHNCEHTPVHIYDGISRKKRKIIVPKYRDKIVLRKSIMLKVSRKARKMSKKDRESLYDIRQLLSYLGWLSCTDTYNMYLKHIKPYINMGKYKKRISEYDKFLKKNERRYWYDYKL